jgi:UDP-glucose 4-epimerase
VAADLRDARRLEQALEDVGVVFHLLGSTQMQAAENDPLADFQTYVVPTIRLLDLARRGAIKILFVSSGGAVYGRQSIVPIAEDRPTHPISSLGRRSLLIEEALRASHDR